MDTLLTSTGAFGENAGESGGVVSLTLSEMQFKGAAATAAAFDDAETFARCLSETLDHWWNTTLPAASNYDATKLTNYKISAGNYAVADQTRLTRRYTQDIYYAIGDLASSVDDGS